MSEKITIREATTEDAQAIAEVHVASWQTTYRDIFPAKELEELSVERRAVMWAESFSKPSGIDFLYVAENASGKVIGFSGGGRTQDGVKGCEGELRVMYLLEAYQRMGIGSRLFDKIVVQFMEVGIDSMFAWALEENPYRKYYDKRGGEVIADRLYEKGGKYYSAVGYGWKDIQTLIDSE
jgi:GNAT superfamily N-acetyltransferase